MRPPILAIVSICLLTVLTVAPLLSRDTRSLFSKCMVWQYDLSLLVLRQERWLLVASPVGEGGPHDSHRTLFLNPRKMQGRSGLGNKVEFQDQLWLGRFELKDILATYDYAKNSTTATSAFVLDVARSLKPDASQDTMITSYIGNRKQTT